MDRRCNEVNAGGAEDADGAEGNLLETSRQINAAQAKMLAELVGLIPKGLAAENP
jgi:hypothetical protein